MKELITKLFTSKDNSTPCTARIMGAGSFIYGNIMQGWEVFVNHVPFDLQKYGMGMAALFAAIGALIKLKEKDEPDA